MCNDSYPFDLGMDSQSFIRLGLGWYISVTIEYISNLCRYPLLILDDFGMERGTEYGLEQVYNVIDSRYRSGKPLIVTTNLTLTELQNPQDTPHARIYDRLLEMCAPVCFSGENFRRESAQNKLNRLKQLMND